MVWLEPHCVHAGGLTIAVPDPAEAQRLLQALAGLPKGPTHWVVDDAWIPCVLMRDIVEVPAGAEAREAFFQWRFGQTLAAQEPQFVQALDLGGSVWLLAGMSQALRDGWLQAAAAAGHPIRSLKPRWLRLYNALAPTLTLPGILLSLQPQGDGTYTGTLAAWGKDLIMVRQWPEPASPEAWNEERVLPTVAYLQRDTHAPLEILAWGAPQWPEGPLPVRILPMSREDY